MKIRHKNKILLEDSYNFTSLFELSRGFMFAKKEKIRKGALFTLPGRRLHPRMSAVTMLFVFHPLDILFLNEQKNVVDKVTLKAWVFSYIPKKASKYLLEAEKGKFKEVNIGDKLNFE